MLAWGTGLRRLAAKIGGAEVDLEFAERETTKALEQALAGC